MIHFMGGGWCTSLDDCVGRSKTDLGSSKSFAKDKDSILGSWDGGVHGLFSSDPSVNPQWANWTKVYVRYCDGASFGGSVAAPVKVGEDTIYFRGRQVLDAVLQHLLSSGLSEAPAFLVNGCSAGGLSVWLHLDYIASQMPSGMDVRGVPECGFFMDLPKYDGTPSYTPLYQTVDKMQNVTGSESANTDCIKANSGQEWRCFMAQYTLPHIKTPFFAVNSVYDAWQAGNIVRISSDCGEDMAKCSPSELASFQNLRTTMLGNLTAHINAHDRPHSAYWTYNCVTHCGQLCHDSRWGTLENAARSATIKDAIGDWWFDGAEGSSVSTAAKAGWGSAGNPTCN